MLQIQTVVTQHLHMLQGESHVSRSQILSSCNSIFHLSRFAEGSHKKKKIYIDITPRIVSLGRLWQKLIIPVFRNIDFMD